MAIKTYQDFWPFYLREHSKPATRALHYIGTSLGLCLWGAAAWIRDWRLLVAGLVVGYALAWVGHFFIQKNRPATFTYPVWSLISDYRMFFTWITGRLGPHLEAAGVR